ncbi:MAG: hypothetical protein OXF04_12635 [bacterium]|nr:hypothetical protein [bacterium]MCY4271476.1 hypothetical protein [bacterium]
MVVDVPDALPQQAEAPGEVERRFSQSMAVSGARCLLTYAVFPFLLPLLGLAGAVGPALGVAIGLVAIAFNGLSIRRFWRADHRLKWLACTVNAAVIVLLCYLTVGDFAELAG